MDNLRTFTPSDVEDLPEEARPVAVFAIQMRERNAAVAGQIEALGGGVEISAAKMDHMLVALCNLGVITELQMWQIHADWEKNLRGQLKESFERMQAIHRERQVEARRKATEKKLIIPGRG